jgi:serine/threonine protein kinase
MPEISYVEEPVLARVSYHVMREERAFHIAKALSASADPRGEHIIKPHELMRLKPEPSDRGPVLVIISAHPGPNVLQNLIDFGPAYYRAHKFGDTYQAYRRDDFKLAPALGLQEFLDFAIGATQCLEIVHHSQGMIHGEIRGDTFHFHPETKLVKLLSFGSGVRSFEHGLTSTGWTALSRELGAKNKLLYISPEQTGRMPAEPDSRTDIYSVGVLLWTLLTQQQVYEGETPLDIVQGVLRRRIPNVSSIRLDIPDTIGRIIQKCTAKNVGDRYHSASGLRHDLVKAREFLEKGDFLALDRWNIGGKDVSSFFILPTMMIGREKERAELVKVIERVSLSHAVHHKGTVNRFSDASSFSELPDGADHSSEGASSAEGNNLRSGSFTHTTSSDPRQSRASMQPSMPSDTQTINSDNISTSAQPVGPLARFSRGWERHHSIGMDMRSLNDASITSGGETNRQSQVESSGSSSLSRQLGVGKFRRRGHCEIVLIEGAAGLGKSFLVQSALAEARRRGYCATAKFETARRTAFGPLLKLLSSLFKQLWGERNTETPFHLALKQYVRPVWPLLHKHLGLPEFLLGPVDAGVSRSASVAQPKSIPNRVRRRGSSPGLSPKPTSPVSNRASVATTSSQDFLRAGTSTKSMRLMNIFLDVLRMFAAHKFICFCLDDVHFADDESLDLITQIISARMRMAIIMTYRPDEMSAEKVNHVVCPADVDGKLVAPPICLQSVVR